ncbi:MAG: RnfH family protein, partial [Steroidobacteraceae bacterium]
RDGDRVEIYRALAQDPKKLRRERAARAPRAAGRRR